MGFMGIIWVVILILIIWWGWSYLKQNRNTGLPGESALDILKQRYARGEIGKEEFEEKKKNLNE